MAFTLTLLGTSTVYTPTPAEDYPRGETLSFVSSLIPGGPLPEDEVFTNATVPLHKASVTLINGPGILGFEVGDRIAKAVISILMAIQRGETKINLIAHSRGAIEAILVAHELERIQQIFNEQNPQTTRNNLLESPALFTLIAMRVDLLKDIFETLLIDQASTKQKLQATRLAIFNIDPVPGGNWHVIPLGWSDERYYRLPEIVSEYEQYIFENERSRSFKAIIPTGGPNTKITILNMPGHHGTGSGNFLDQQKRPVDPSLGDTRQVQECLVVKLIGFLHRNGVIFQFPALDSLPAAASEDQLALTRLVHKTTNRDGIICPQQIKATCLALYNTIAKNKAAYASFDNGSYLIVGQEQSLHWLIRRSTKNDRMLRQAGHQDTFLQDNVPPVACESIVNAEHLHLTIRKDLDFNTDLPLHELIEQVGTKLLKHCEHSEQAKDLAEKKTTGDALTASFIGSPIASVINEPESINAIINSLAPITSHISQTYLNEQIHTDNSMRAIHEIAIILNVLEELAKSNPLAVRMRSHILTSIQETLNQKRELLIESTDYIISALVDSSEDLDPSIFTQIINIPNQFLQYLKEITQIAAEFPNKINLDIHTIKREFAAREALLINSTADYIIRRKLTLHEIERPVPDLNHENCQKMLALPEIKEQIPELTLNVHWEKIKLLVNSKRHPDFIRERDEADKAQMRLSTLLQKLQAQNNRLRTEIATLSDKLLTDQQTLQEAEYIKVIDNKLKPLTKTYLNHLIKVYNKAEKPNPAIAKIENNALTPEVLIKISNTTTLGKKIYSINTLYQDLLTMENKASCRVQNFKQHLTEFSKDISLHRDVRWKRFLLNAAIIIGVTLTGILPGLVGLGLISAARGKSARFWKSEGEIFHDNCKNEKLVANSPSAP